jgi:hypothetical protein
MNKPSIVQKPIATENYTKGRGGTPIRKITFHHVVGSLESCYAVFTNPTRGGSSTYGVGDGRIWQFISHDDTPWTNGNWNSNLESITIEHEGDWRFGYWNEGTINTSAKLVAWLRTLYPGIGYNRHREVSLKATECPGDFPVEEVWNRATALMKADAPIEVPTPIVNLKVTDITNRVVILNKDANLWDLSFTAWDNAKSIKTYPKGTQIEVSAVANHPLGGTYYLTEYSYSKGVMNGFNAKDCDELPPPVVIPPVTPPEPPITPEPPIVVIPPIVIEPPVIEPPKHNWLVLLKVLIERILDFINKLKKG